MRFVTLLFACCLASTAFADEAKVPTISTEDLIARMKLGTTPDHAFAVIDVRSRVEFEEAHLPGAIRVSVGQASALLPKTIQDKKTELIFYCNGPKCAKSAEAARTALDLGYKHVRDYNEGMPGWARAKQQVAGTPLPQVEIGRESVDELQTAIKAGKAPMIIDLRDPREYQNYHLAGAVNIPLDEVEKRVGEIPPSSNVVLACHAGQQSLLGGRLLNKLGRKWIKMLDGGILAWRERGLPVEARPLAQAP
jgi:rhodanese-related sulfurtransferase